MCLILAGWLQAQLREKQKQVKGLMGELNMEQAAGLEHRHSVQRLQQELQDVKQLCLEAKRQVHLRRHILYEDVHHCSVLAPGYWCAEGYSFSPSLYVACLLLCMGLMVSVREPKMESLQRS